MTDFSPPNLSDLFNDCDDDVYETLRASFDVQNAQRVPQKDDIQFGNHAKKFETAALFIDIRGSTKLTNLLKDDEKLAAVYKSFLTSMVRAAKRFDGHVRSFQGDRILVLFDPGPDVMQRVVFLGATMDTIVQSVLNRALTQKGLPEITCGVGAWFGETFAVKAGLKRDPTKHDLVWIGETVNHASKLCDLAAPGQIVVSKEIFLAQPSYWSEASGLTPSGASS